MDLILVLPHFTKWIRRGMGFTQPHKDNYLANIGGWELTVKIYNMSYVKLLLNSNQGNFLIFKTIVLGDFLLMLIQIDWCVVSCGVVMLIDAISALSDGLYTSSVFRELLGRTNNCLQDNKIKNYLSWSLVIIRHMTIYIVIFVEK